MSEGYTLCTRLQLLQGNRWGPEATINRPFHKVTQSTPPTPTPSKSKLAHPMPLSACPLLIVWDDAINDDLVIPKGKYYLADAGFAACDQLLLPYQGVCYYLAE